MEFTRRHLTAAAGAAAATTFTRTALGGWEPSERYPDPAIQILDPSFAKYRLARARRARLPPPHRPWAGAAALGPPPTPPPTAHSHHPLPRPAHTPAPTTPSSPP